MNISDLEGPCNSTAMLAVLNTQATSMMVPHSAVARRIEGSTLRKLSHAICAQMLVRNTAMFR